MKQRYAEEQIRILRKADAGAAVRPSVADMHCRSELPMCETFLPMDVGDATRLKMHQAERAR